MEIKRESLTLLLADLRRSLDVMPDSTARPIRLRLAHFEMMYLPRNGFEMPKDVLLLRARSGEYYVCDEYNPQDRGRCHVLEKPSFYAYFDRVEYTLEFQKTIIDIEEIVYEGPDWPSEIRHSRASVLEHFGID